MAAIGPEGGPAAGGAVTESGRVTTWMDAVPALLLVSELTLALTHLKVLWCIGSPYSVSYLSGQRWRYFVWDLLSAQSSLAALHLLPPLLAPPAIPRAAADWLPLVAAAALAHAVLHVYYIATWNQPHTRQVVAMSAQRSVAERRRRFQPLAVAWYHLGTGFDVATHLALAAALLGSCGAGSRLAALVGVAGELAAAAVSGRGSVSGRLGAAVGRGMRD